MRNQKFPPRSTAPPPPPSVAVLAIPTYPDENPPEKIPPRRPPHPQELQTFAGIFPSANYMVSNNLLTPNRTELAARDRASLEAVERWLSDERFSALKSHILSVQSRLRNFVNEE